jgi:predicted ATP-dependent endonuclease of OLD family
MKVKSLLLQGYKRFPETNKPFDFYDKDTGLIQNLTLIVGENGKGKSTILQAIASLLGTATGKIKKPSSLNWAGYNYALLNSSSNVKAELTCQFTEDELIATTELSSAIKSFGDVSKQLESSISLDYLRDKLVQTPNQLNQFKGRRNAIEYRKLAPNDWTKLDRVGFIMWYTEHRGSTSLSSELNGKSQVYDEETLRKSLNSFYTFHSDIVTKTIKLRDGQRDVYKLLNDSFSAVFTDKILLRPNASYLRDIDSPPYFYIKDNSTHHQYEISEMSGGERALFPILFDFAFWKVNNSVILIDELELHLHPPLQQAFLRALPQLGSNNQFIITTHSDYVASLVSEDSIIRLD